MSNLLVNFSHTMFTFHNLPKILQILLCAILPFFFAKTIFVKKNENMKINSIPRPSLWRYTYSSKPSITCVNNVLLVGNSLLPYLPNKITPPSLPPSSLPYPPPFSYRTSLQEGGHDRERVHLITVRVRRRRLTGLKQQFEIYTPHHRLRTHSTHWQSAPSSHKLQYAIRDLIT